MILAGIDEAGYGPLLGPLVVGCSAFELSDLDGADPRTTAIPCLWKRLRKLVSKSRVRSGKKLHVNDSKQVYNPSAGLKERERSILALASSTSLACEDLLGFLRHVSPHVVQELAGYAWYNDHPAA